MKIGIVGAGLVGSLLSIFLKRRGYDVVVNEKRKDPRTQAHTEGRSINLVLAHRGLAALEKLGLREEMLQFCVPLKGRMVHYIDGHTHFQPYGKEGEAINSISRKLLNEKLLDVAEKTGVEILFEKETQELSDTVDFTIGADGFGSQVRQKQVHANLTHEEITVLAHGYKELTIPADHKGQWQLEKHALHIWPREQFMLIALPNIDGSFTCTLFLQLEGPQSFQSTDNLKAFKHFIQTQFPDVYPLLTQLDKDFQNNPVSKLMYMQCWPWLGENSVIIGDAAHAIVPFYGQGMNAGFEDCHILYELLENHSFVEALEKYQHSRKPNTDAICQLSLENFIEMRDKVADKGFQEIKKLSNQLAELYPKKWIPQYSQVTFTDIPYAEAKVNGEKQTKVLKKIISLPGYDENWVNNPTFKEQVSSILADFFS